MELSRKATWLQKAQRNAKFAELLRSARKESSVGQQELARRIEKPQSFVSNLENGKIHITLVDLEDFAFAIGTDPATLLRRLYPQKKSSI